jgi:O-antigen ligase
MAAIWLVYLLSSRKVELREKVFLFIFIGHFAAYVWGLLNSENMSQAWLNLEKRLSLLVFPLVFSTIPPFAIKRQQLLVKAFVLSCLLACLYTFRKGFGFLNTENRTWTVGDLTTIHRPYLGLYCAFSILALLLFVPNKGWFSKFLKLALGLFFVLFLYIIYAKAAIAGFTLILLLLTNLYLIDHKRYRTLLAVDGALLGTILLSLLTVPRLRTFANTIITFKPFSYEEYNTQLVDSFNIRRDIWGCVVQVLGEKFTWLFGVGIDSMEQHLTPCYVTKLLDQRGEFYNPHNEYLETWLTLGLLGIVLFMLALIVPAIKRFGSHNYLYLSFLLLFAISSLTESTLGVQKGIIFYAFFNSLFAFHHFPAYEQPSPQPL